jgi:hypothetical protein
MGEPRALGQGPPTPRNYVVTGQAARSCVTRGLAIPGFGTPPAATHRAYQHTYQVRANRGAIQ